jgi:2-oxoglutarate ferredoxin oxidoreductase subunit delta
VAPGIGCEDTSPRLAPRTGLLIYTSAVVTTKNKTNKQVPVFSSTRCKRCGICSHFCPTEAIGVDGDGMPYLADSGVCTSCGLCSDMCPDWAVFLTEVGQEDAAAEGDGLAGAGESPRGPSEPADHAGK